MSMKANELPLFMTIREVAKTGILSEYCLRQMIKEDRLPCIYSGNRCLINYTALLEALKNMRGNK